MAGRPEEEIEKLFEDTLRELLQTEDAAGLPGRLLQGEEGTEVPYADDQI